MAHLVAEPLAIAALASALTSGAIGLAIYYRYCRRSVRTVRRADGRVQRLAAGSEPIKLISAGKTQRFSDWLRRESNFGGLDRKTLLDLAMNATFRNNAAILSQILEQKARDTGKLLRRSFGSSGWNSNPLFIAIKMGHKDCIEMMLEKEVPIELATTWEGECVIESMEKKQQLSGEIKKIVDMARKTRRKQLSERLKLHGLNRKTLDPIAILIAEYIGV